MAGYCGKKMSNNAVAAYAAGEKPLSRWTKKEVLEEISTYSDCDFSKLTKAEILDNFFAHSSWHHTGMFYNCTDFYSMDYAAIQAADQAQINAIIADRSPRVRRDADTIAAEKAAKEKRKTARMQEERLKLLFEKQTRYKSMSGFKNNPAYIAACDAALEAATDAKIDSLHDIWTREAAAEKRAQLLARLEDRALIQRMYIKSI